MVGMASLTVMPSKKPELTIFALSSLATKASWVMSPAGDHLHNGQAEGFGKIPVPLVMAGHGP